MNRNASDFYLEVLGESWNEKEGFLDVDVACKRLGSTDEVGYLLAGVLGSDLRGWHAIAAREIHRIAVHHSDPPEAWIERIWDFAIATLTSDPDEMTHLFGLIESARSDMVRSWVAEPLVALAERDSEVYRWWGFEGLECLILSGGTLHLRPFLHRLAALAQSVQSPKFQKAARLLLQLARNQPQDLPVVEKGPDNVKGPLISWTTNQRLPAVNKYPMNNQWSYAA